MIRSVYLAGSSYECRMVAGYAARLIDAGYTLAYDWMTQVDRARLQGLSDASLSTRDRLHTATAELDAVRSCDVFWLVAPEAPSRGCWVELGARLTVPIRRGARTIVSGDYAASIFTELADMRFATHDEAMEWLLGEGR